MYQDEDNQWPRSTGSQHVYNLQLDREIFARREYELNVETHLRREMANELSAQSTDEIAALRAPNWQPCAPISRFCSTPTSVSGRR